MATLNYDDFETAGADSLFEYNGKLYTCRFEENDECNEFAVILTEHGQTDWKYVIERDRDTMKIKHIDEA